MLTIKQSAKALGVSYDKMLSMVRQGKVKAEEHDGEYLISNNALANYTAQNLDYAFGSLDALSVDDILSSYCNPTKQ